MRISSLVFSDEMLDQVGHLEMDDEGIRRAGTVLVRHLVLPGHLDEQPQMPPLPGRAISGYFCQYHVAIFSSIQGL